MNIVDLIGADIPLTKRGKDFWAPCPWHGEKTPSFSVSPDKGFFFCFGCSATGDAIDWLRKYRGLSFPEAAKVVGKVLAPLPPRQPSAWHAAADAILALTQERAEFHLRWPLAQAKLTEMANLPDQWGDTAKVEAINEWLLLLDWDKALRRIEEKIWERCESILAP